jgi:hypothetical protein
MKPSARAFGGNTGRNCRLAPWQFPFAFFLDIQLSQHEADMERSRGVLDPAERLESLRRQKFTDSPEEEGSEENIDRVGRYSHCSYDC